MCHYLIISYQGRRGNAGKKGTPGPNGPKGDKVNALLNKPRLKLQFTYSTLFKLRVLDI